jgi:uncharacterized membrane protein SpoIIM required for sporulation
MQKASGFTALPAVIMAAAASVIAVIFIIHRVAGAKNQSHGQEVKSDWKSF